ncbi:hypothetical protein TSMEX_002881 [Taenia solium]|eukprot:TsM_000590100 transcript=TsM_000590100 gene=TsM_000590100
MQGLRDWKTFFKACQLFLLGSTMGHEAMAGAVRQSAYFQHLPELPVSCRQFDGDASNIPIIFEDVYLPLTDDQQLGNSSIHTEPIDSMSAQRNGTAPFTTENTVLGAAAKPVRYSLDDGCINTGLNHHPVVEGDLWGTECY